MMLTSLTCLQVFKFKPSKRVTASNHAAPEGNIRPGSKLHTRVTSGSLPAGGAAAIMIGPSRPSRRVAWRSFLPSRQVARSSSATQAPRDPASPSFTFVCTALSPRLHSITVSVPLPSHSRVDLGWPI
jgi:hypothetical protein